MDRCQLGLWGFSPLDNPSRQLVHPGTITVGAHLMQNGSFQAEEAFPSSSGYKGLCGPPIHDLAADIGT